MSSFDKGGCKARDDEEADWRQPDMSRLFELGAPATEPKKDIYLQFFSGTPMIECARDLGLPLANVRAALLELRDKRLAFAEDELRMAFLAAKSKAEFCGVTGQTEGVYDLLQIRFGE